MDVGVKFGISESNDFRDIRGADFVSKEGTGRRLEAFRLKVNTFMRFAANPK